MGEIDFDLLLSRLVAMDIRIPQIGEFPHFPGVHFGLLDPAQRAGSSCSFAWLDLMCNLFPLLDLDAFQAVPHTLVTSQLNYCNVLQMGLPLKTTWKL